MSIHAFNVSWLICAWQSRTLMFFRVAFSLFGAVGHLKFEVQQRRLAGYVWASPSDKMLLWLYQDCLRNAKVITTAEDWITLQWGNKTAYCKCLVASVYSHFTATPLMTTDDVWGSRRVVPFHRGRLQPLPLGTLKRVGVKIANGTEPHSCFKTVCCVGQIEHKGRPSDMSVAFHHNQIYSQVHLYLIQKKPGAPCVSSLQLTPW